MKPAISVFFLCITLAPLWVNGQVWKFGGPKDDFVVASAAYPDGSSVLAGYTYSYGSGKSDVWLLGLDPEGDERWRRYLGGKDHDWVNDLILTRNGAIVICGGARDSLTTKKYGWVMQLSRTGVPVWTRAFTGPGDQELRSVAEVAGGGLLACGQSRRGKPLQGQVWLLRLDVRGGNVWEKTLPAAGREQANSVVRTPDGDFAIGGFSFADTALRSQALVLRVSEAGEVKWKKTFGEKRNEVIEQVTVAPDGRWFAAGWASSVEGPSQVGLLLHLSGEGERVWEESYGEAGKNVFAAVTPAAAGGGLLLTGRSTPPDSDEPRFWVVRTDRNGRPLWELVSGAGAQGRDLTAVPGGWLAAGSVRQRGAGWDYLACRFDDAGRGCSLLSRQNEAPTKPDLTPVPDPAPVAAKPALWLVAVGVSDFQDERLNLKFAAIDAFLLTQKYTEIDLKQYSQVHTLCLTDTQATRAGVQRAMDSVATLPAVNDLMVVYFSTHGVPDELGNLYLLPHDADPNHLEETAWAFQDMVARLSKTRARKLVLLDACHSGSSSASLLPAPPAADAASVNSAAAAVALRDQRITLMTSSSADEYSYEHPSLGHSAFAYAFLEGLDGGADFNGDRSITLFEMNLYLTQRVEELTKGRQHPFTPVNLFGNVVLYEAR
jgi:uncharacterized caspase-like protein